MAQRIEEALGVCPKITFMEESSLQAESRGKKQPLVIDKRKL
jgi:hypothetical protein